MWVHVCTYGHWKSILLKLVLNQLWKSVTPSEYFMYYLQTSLYIQCCFRCWVELCYLENKKLKRHKMYMFIKCTRVMVQYLYFPIYYMYIVHLYIKYTYFIVHVHLYMQKYTKKHLKSFFFYIFSFCNKHIQDETNIAWTNVMVDISYFQNL